MNPLERLDLKIAHLRFRGYGGTSIKPHRSIYHIELHKGDLLIAVLLPLAFNFLLITFLDQILMMWRAIFEFWLDRLNGGTGVSLHAVDLGNYVLWLPVPRLTADLPGSTLWRCTLIACILIYLATYFIPAERFLPLTYIVRACLFLQATALAFFFFVPARFPYGLSDYIEDALTMSFFFMFMIPWILGVTYYVFNFPLVQKIALTCLILGYFLAALPMQYLGHAYFLHHATLLFLPLCYLVFGIFMDVMMFVAFYAWGMSWRFGGLPGMRKREE
jgi:hypothetical protein